MLAVIQPRIRHLSISTRGIVSHTFSVKMSTQNKPRSRKNANPNKQPALTHFLCVPLVTSSSQPQLETSLADFKRDVCTPASEGAVKEDDTPEGSSEKPTPPIQAPMIAEKAVRPVGSLHLTLGVMSLDASKLEKATELLKSLDLEQLPHSPSTSNPDIKEPTTTIATENQSQPTSSLTDKPLNISLTSLHPMQAPHKTSILYISPEDATNRLLPLCSALRTQFSDARFLIPDTRPLKLHATVVNTIYVKGRKKSKPKGNVKADEKVVKEDEPTDDTAKPEDGGSDATTSETKQEPESEGKPDTGIETKPNTADEAGFKANDTNSGHGPDAKAPLRFDAREIIQRYRDHIWAKDFAIDRIAICEMGAKKILDDEGKVVREEYKEVAVRKLPGC